MEKKHKLTFDIFYNLIRHCSDCFFLLFSGKFDEVYNLLENANPNMAVYKREDIPDDFHYKHNVRIMPIIIEVKEGWTIVQNKTEYFMCEYKWD